MFALASVAFTLFYAFNCLMFGNQAERDAPACVSTRASVAVTAFNVAIVGPALATWFLTVAVAPLSAGDCVAWRQYAAAAGAALLYDLMFWALHSVCHSSALLYRHVHAWHHRWERTTHARSAFDAHPLEMACVNVAPLLLALWLTGAHAVTCVAVLLIGTAMTQRTHADWAGTHDKHHAHRVCGLGALGYADALFGTTCAVRCAAGKRVC